ncbi:MAG TPA: hypothetical protein VKF32_16410, partial [Thermoanaerobaculia bacterium]|nr:hypothetical protein [Thermoanaerobaculia bacterium]
MLSRSTVVVLLLAVSIACSTVPKEVVELSYRIGQDLESVRTSYRALIHAHFDTLRQQRIRYLENEWVPKYVRNWVEDGHLRDFASGSLVWSVEKQDYVPPAAAHREEQLLQSVHSWALSAVLDIQDKKASLLQPLDKSESDLTASVNEAFDELSRGNATITAHLNSLRKVQEVQDAALQALHIKTLRDDVNDALVKASDEAAKALDKVRAADGLVKTIGDTIKRKP